MMERAYSILTVKAVGEEQRVIRGWATTPEPDRIGDVVEPLGAVFRNPLPLLHQHDSHAPVGTVALEKPTRRGIEFTARLPKIAEPGPLKDRVDTAWGELRAGLVRGVSIGFRPLDGGVERMEKGLRFTKTEILELSLVTVAANAGASITEIRSLDRKQRAASGHSANAPIQIVIPPASRDVKPTSGHHEMTTVSERITTLETLRGQKAARIDEVLQKALGANRTTEEGERSECMTLKSEIEVIDGDLDLLRFQERGLAAASTPVGSFDLRVQAMPTRAFAMAKPPEPEPGIRIARLVRCKALARLEQADAARIAEREYGTRDPYLVQFIKAGEVPAMTTTAGGDGFIPTETGLGDYAEFLRPQTVLGKFGTNGIPSLRRVPFRSGLVSMDTGAIGYWVGEAKAKPLTMIDSSRTHLLPLKTAAIIVLTMELVRDSSPSAEMAIRADMTQAIVARIDQTFIDPAVTAVAGVSPASITHGQPAVASGGADADAIRTDLRSLFALFDAAHNPASGAVLVMSSANARALGFMVNPLGQAEFPGMNVSGGAMLGVPVIVSDYADDTVALISAGDVYLADEGGVAIDMSTEASLEMSSTPAQHADGTPAGAAMVSLWQGNLIGFRAERTINWGHRRPVTAPYLTGVEWGGPVTAPTP